MKRLFSYLALALFITGVTGFLFNLLTGSGILSVNAELPLFGIQGVVERNNQIYIGLGFYNRVQSYDLNGNYSGYSKTKNYSKDYDFTIDENGNPKIVVNYYKAEVNELLKDVLKSTCLGDSCIYYKIENKIPLKLICSSRTGKDVIIQQSIFKTLWSGPVNPWLIGLSGVLLFSLINITRIALLFRNRLDLRNNLKMLIMDSFR